ncbi:MAG: 2Fe-2S iron-sulfur cluster-binding protein [Sandaracinaceae bacterium]
MDHLVELAGEPHSFDAPAGQSVLMAGLAAGIPLPYECSSGTCGCCKARLLEGTVRDRAPAAAGLTPRDRRRGRVLLCQCEATSDLRLQVSPVEGLPAEPRPRDLSLCVTRLERPGPRTLRVVASAGTAVPFLPGQYVLLRIPGVGRRAYSMANPSGDEGLLELLVKAVPGGEATAYLFDRLAEGDAIEAEGPFGRAYLREAAGGPLRCVAGGSGLAPLLSIARAALPAGAEVDFFYGARTREDLVCVDELERLARVHGGRLRVVTCLSEPSPRDGWAGPRGNVGDVFFAQVADLAEAPIYLAGPPPMVDAVLRGCVVERGLPADRVRFDRFF